jgi:hypothetical protein
VLDCTRAIAQRLRPGQLVVLESTTYPGTNREVVLALLLETGLVLGREFRCQFPLETRRCEVRWTMLFRRGRLTECTKCDLNPATHMTTDGWLR